MIPNWLDKILSFVKESTKTFFIVGASCIIIIFFSDQLGTVVIRETFNPYLKIITVFCIIGIIANIAPCIAKWGFDKYAFYIRRSNTKRRMRNFTTAEKEIMRQYIKFQNRVQRLPVNSGVVSDLCRIGVIVPPTKYFDNVAGSRCQFNITDFAWDYLNSNPDLVEIINHKITQQSGGEGPG